MAITEADITFAMIMVGLGSHLREVTPGFPANNHSVVTCDECYQLIKMIGEIKDEIDADKHL